jgi:hypothetical protein
MNYLDQPSGRCLCDWFSRSFSGEKRERQGSSEK